VGPLPPSVDATSLVLGGHAADSPATTFVRGALAEATHYVFLGLLAVAVLSVGALLLMPRKTEQLEF
ncbi:MFS transporter, partial [Amycolatopsis mediterranei]